MNMKDLFHDAIVNVLSHIYQPVYLDVDENQNDPQKIEYDFRLSEQTAKAIAESLKDYLTRYLPGKIYIYNVITPIASMSYNPAETNGYIFSSVSRVYFNFESEHLELEFISGISFQNQGNGKWYRKYHYNRQTVPPETYEYEYKMTKNVWTLKREDWPPVLFWIMDELNEILLSNGFSLFTFPEDIRARARTRSEANPQVIYFSPGLRMLGDNIHVTLHSYLLLSSRSRR